MIHSGSPFLPVVSYAGTLGAGVFAKRGLGAPKRIDFMLILRVATVCVLSDANASAASPRSHWPSASRFRVELETDLRGQRCSDCPVSVDIDFQHLLQSGKEPGSFDEHSVEVLTTSDPPRRVAHRVDSFFGISRVTLHFPVPNALETNFAVYFDTRESRQGQPRRYAGLVGDGDRFSEGFGQREIGASHFDAFVDFDGDGDLDLFKGGVEPFVYCWENTGKNQFISRGRLSVNGQVFTLPCSKAQRSWVTVAFHDIDGDGDQDFFPSFGDGPDAGRIVFYRNVTRPPNGLLAFDRVGPLQAASGTPLAGGEQAGGWFPSVCFVQDWDGDGRGPDVLVGSKNRCWLYRNISEEGNSLVFAEAIALMASGREIELPNPRFDVADFDNDGDLDLFAGTQPGAVHLFQNIGSSARPRLAPGQVVAWTGKYLIADAHSGVKLADFDGDGRVDLASGRFWERADLHAPRAPRDFGGLWKNARTRGEPRFIRTDRRAPVTEQFQPCDAIRQNSVRAVDWDEDGKPDLLAGDTDGFIWFFRNLTGTFAGPERLLADGTMLSVAATGGHARFDVCDWNNDGRKDLVTADGSGTVQLFLNCGSKRRPRLAAAGRLTAENKAIQLGGRASVLVCDWNNDARKDLVLADEKGYYVSRNIGTDQAPSLGPITPITFSGKTVRYVRPNLGSFVDWDGDGKRDLIGCHFENSIRFYRNIGSGARGEDPKFSDAEGVILLEGESPQMISGVDVVDWNRDGDLDLLTGQGHGGSSLRFFERDWIEMGARRERPVVRVVGFKTRSESSIRMTNVE